MIQPIDSVTAKISINELKYITIQFIELNAARSENTLLKSEVGILKRTVADKDKIIDLRNGIINTLREEMKTIKPSWYDKFTIGFGSAVVAVLGLLLLLK